MNLSSRVENPGPRLTREEIAAYSRKHAVTIPADLQELLLSTNGGRFVDYTRLPIEGGFLSIDLLCRLEEGHLDDIAEIRSLISDRLEDRYVPAVYTASGDFLVVDSSGEGVFLWSHEWEELSWQGVDLPEVLGRLYYEPTESNFETACKTATLDQLKKSSFFDDQRANVSQEAARQGNLRLVADCIESGLPEGKTLRFAAMNGRVEIIEFLLARGWDINRLEEDGRTVLDWTEWKPEYHEIVKRLGGVSSKDL